DASACALAPVSPAAGADVLGSAPRARPEDRSALDGAGGPAPPVAGAAAGGRPAVRGGERARLRARDVLRGPWRAAAGLAAAGGPDWFRLSRRQPWRVPQPGASAVPRRRAAA